MGRLLRVFAVLVALGLVIAANYLRPIDAVAASPILPRDQRIPGQPPELPWPVGGAAGAAGGRRLLGGPRGESPPPLGRPPQGVGAAGGVAGPPPRPR